MSVDSFVYFIVAIPPLLFGWFKPYGMKLEVFLRTAVISLFIAPKHRKFIINNYYHELEKQADLLNEDGQKIEGKSFSNSISKVKVPIRDKGSKTTYSKQELRELKGFK